MSIKIIAMGLILSSVVFVSCSSGNDTNTSAAITKDTIEMKAVAIKEQPFIYDRKTTILV